MLSKTINFPLFAIGSYKKLWIEHNITYILSESDILYKVDNKNLPYDTLAKRRLRIDKKQRYKFVETIFTYAQLIKCGRNLFIDYKGNLIKYKKDRRANLVYKKINTYKAIEGHGYLLYVNGVTNPILVSAIIFNFQKYVGLLYIDKSYLLYELSEERKPNSWRKI